MSWADNLRDRLHNDRDSLIAPADRDALRKAAQQPQVRAFGSKAVVYQLRSVQLGLAGLADVISPLSMHEYTELNPEEVPHAMRVAEERSAALVIAELTSLEEVVRAELQPFERHVPDRVRLPWRIRIRLARRRLIKHRSR